MRRTIILSIFLLLTAGHLFAAPIAFETGTYVLMNHPDGNAAEPFYGLRLDNLWGEGAFTFDFERDCVGCGVTMVYDGSTIDISGVAYGGHPDDDQHADDDYDGRYEFNMRYENVVDVENDDDGLQDIGVLAANQMTATGTLTFLDSPDIIKPSWALTDKAGSHPYSVRIGDTDDDDGHRGFGGISGWGWLLFASLNDVTSSDPIHFQDYSGAQDFLFTARKVPVPVPPTAALFLVGLVALASRRRR